MSNELTGGRYDPTELWGDMRLTEAEMFLAAEVASDRARYDDDYSSIEAGSMVRLVTVTEEGEDAQEFEVVIDRIAAAVTSLDEVPGDPPSKIFEGTLVKSSRLRRKPEDEVFGFIFPQGRAEIVDSGPDTDETNRRILASLALRSQSRKAS